MTDGFAATAEGRAGAAVGEFPVPTPIREEQIRLAVYAVVHHVADGRLPEVRCSRDGQPHPCRLGRWGRWVLLAAGLPYRRIVGLVAAGDPYAWPLP